MGAKTLWRGESRKLSRVLRRGHVSKITFKGNQPYLNVLRAKSSDPPSPEDK